MNMGTYTPLAMGYIFGSLVAGLSLEFNLDQKIGLSYCLAT